MVSQIDPTVPVFGSPTTASVRNNFLIARNEISALQAAIGITLPLPISSGGTGADDLLDAQTNLQVLPLTGGTVTGQILLTAAPSSNQSAVPKSYVDGNFPVAITNGGTGATSAAQALINLGGVGLNSPAFTGTPTAPTVPASDNSNNLATTAYVKSVIATLPVGITSVTGGTGITVTGTGAVTVALTTPVSVLNGGTGGTNPVTALANLGGAPIANPNFTGTPTAPTAPLSTNTTQLATTAFVEAAIAAAVAGVASITAGNGITVTPVSGVGNVTVSLTSPVTIANGGTGASTGNSAFDNLLGGISSGSGFITRQTGGAYSITPATLTPANRSLIINGSNAISTSAIMTDNGTAIGITGPLNASGLVTASAGLTISGGNLSVAGTINVQGNTTNTIAGTLDLSNALVAGNLVVDGTTTLGTGGQSTNALLNVNGTSSPAQISAVSNSALNIRVDNGIAMLYFLYQTSTHVGDITTNGSTTAYNTSSDARLKEDVKEPDEAVIGAIIDKLDPVEFTWINNPDLGRRLGFLAQDVHEAYPQAVTPGLGEPGEEGFRSWTIDQSTFVPLLVSEMKFIRKRVAMLEAEFRSIKEVLEAATAAANTPAPTAPEPASEPAPRLRPATTPTPTPTPRRR